MARRRRERSQTRSPRAAEVALFGYLVLLLGIPSQLVVPPLGAAGSPSQILAVLLLLWWVASTLAAPLRTSAQDPVRWMLLAFALAVVGSYVVGALTPLAGEQRSSSDRAVITLAAWAGIAVFSGEALRSRDRLDTMLKAVAGGVTLVAALGIVQFFTGLDIAHYIAIPGLRANSAFGELSERSSFRRVTSTTSHPIEFGVVLAMALPLVLHFALTAPRGARLRWWAAVAVVGVALPMPVARSAVIGAAVVLLVLFPSWEPAVRRKALVVLPVAAVAMSFAVPGLLGTLRSLFTNAAHDPSTQGRTADYGPVAHAVGQHPWLGRGTGTALPSIFRTLDNQYLGLVVESGLLGLCAFVVLLTGAIFVARGIRSFSSDPVTRSLAQALCAALAVPLVTFATFDGLAFSMCAGLLFLVLGIVSALWRIEMLRVGEPVLRPGRSARRQHSRTLLATGAAVLLVSGAGYVLAGRQPPRYESLGSVVFAAPPRSGTNGLLSAGSADLVTSIVHDAMLGPEISARLHAAGVRSYQLAIGNGSLDEGTDIVRAGSTLHAAVWSSDPARADAGLRAVLDASVREVDDLQAQAGVLPALRVTGTVLQALPPSPATGNAKRAMLGFGLTGLLVTGAAVRVAALRNRRWLVHEDRCDCPACVVHRSGVEWSEDAYAHA